MIQSLVLTGPKKLELQTRPIRQPGPQEVLIRIKACGICHSDFFQISGEDTRMKYPTVPGHEYCGIVEKCGQAVEHIKEGDRVACLSYCYCGTCSYCRRGMHIGCENIILIPFQMDGGLQEMLCAPATTLYPFDETLSFAEASVTEPAANACCVAELANIYQGEDIVIIGPGPIGLLAIQFANLYKPGRIIMLGTRNERLQLAERFGATNIINVLETDPYQAVMDITQGRGANAVLLCGGAEDAWNLAGSVLATFGKIVVEVVPPTMNAAWPAKIVDFIGKGIRYYGAYGYNPDHFDTALKLIQSRKIDVAPLITHKFALKDYQEAFETSEKRKGGAIKVVFEM